MSSRTAIRLAGIPRPGCETCRSILQRDVRLAALIPARYAAQRLPGKPLADIGGAPMVVRVAQQAALAEGIDEVAGAARDARPPPAGFPARLPAPVTQPPPPHRTG